MKTSEIIQNAHDYLLAHKWLRGEFAKTTDGQFLTMATKVQLVAKGDGTGRVIDCCCAEGAAYAGNPTVDSVIVCRALKRAAQMSGVEGYFPEFNDNVAHDKRDVLRKFRVAIRQLKKEGN